MQGRGQKSRGEAERGLADFGNRWSGKNPAEQAHQVDACEIIDVVAHSPAITEIEPTEWSHAANIFPPPKRGSAPWQIQPIHQS
jgi:hypothetical protein